MKTQRTFKYCILIFAIFSVASGLAPAHADRVLIDVETEIFTLPNRPRLCSERAAEVTPSALAFMLFRRIDNGLIVLEHIRFDSIKEGATNFFANEQHYKPELSKDLAETEKKILATAIKQRGDIFIALAEFLRGQLKTS